MIQTVEQLFGRLSAGDLSIARGEAGVLLLRGPDEEKTPEILAALKKFRKEVDAALPAVGIWPEPWDSAVRSELVGAVLDKMNLADPDNATWHEWWKFMDKIMDCEVAEDMDSLRPAVAALDRVVDLWLAGRSEEAAFEPLAR